MPRKSPSGCEVSVVIATRNRYELVEFTLLSLYEQSAPAESFEVIVIDDASTDGTAQLLAGLQPPFTLKILRNETNQGAARSRNRGIRESKGSIIVILDEMLVDRDYIQGHIDYHRRNPKCVVTTSFNGQHIYTHYYSNFTSGQKRECLDCFPYMDASHPEIRDAGRQLVRLVQPSEVVDHRVLRFGLIHEPSKRSFDLLQKAYGESLEKAAIPWVMLITNSVSVNREMLDKAGLFDEEFKGAWLEDWELGYRLHKAGARFINAGDIACYHQAHPINNTSRLENYLYFAGKHPVTEVLLVGTMNWPLNWSLHQWGIIVTQYKELKQMKGNAYPEWTEAFHDLALSVNRLASKVLVSRYPACLQSGETGYSRWSPRFSSLVKNQFEQLNEKGEYRELLRAFQALLPLPIIR